MINKLKNEFTHKMVLKSQEVLGQDDGIEMGFKIFLDEEHMKDLSPEEHSVGLMHFFQKENKIRPEILLDRENDLSKLAFPTEKHFEEFCHDLTRYQEDEQVLLLNHHNGLKINKSLFDESAVMKYKNPLFEKVEIDMPRLKKVIPIIDKAYGNVQKLNESGKYEMYSNSDSVLPEISVADSEAPDYEMLKENPKLPVNAVVLGQEQPNLDLTKIASNLDNMYNLKDKSQEEIQELDDNLMKKVSERYAEIKKEHISVYQTVGNIMYRDGRRKIEFENRFMGKRFNRPYKRTYLSAEPEPQDIVTGLLATDPKHVLQFPHSEKNEESFREALIKIRDEELCDINEITLSRNKDKVDPVFRKILEEVKNGQKLVLGEELKDDKQGVDNKKDGAVLGDDKAESKPDKTESKAKPINKTENINVPDKAVKTDGLTDKEEERLDLDSDLDFDDEIEEDLDPNLVNEDELDLPDVEVEEELNLDEAFQKGLNENNKNKSKVKKEPTSKQLDEGRESALKDIIERSTVTEKEKSKKISNNRSFKIK